MLVFSGPFPINPHWWDKTKKRWVHLPSIYRLSPGDEIERADNPYKQKDDRKDMVLVTRVKDEEAVAYWVHKTEIKEKP